MSRTTAAVAIGAGWLAWLPFAYAGLTRLTDWTDFAAPIVIGGVLVLLAALGWSRTDPAHWVSWLALVVTVANIGALGWTGGGRLGGVAVALAGVLPSLLIAWGFIRLWPTAPIIKRLPTRSG